MLFLSQADPDRAGGMRGVIGEALGANGWVEGRNLVLEARYARIDSKDVAALVAEGVRGSPEVIMATGSPLTAALRDTGTAIPCVFVAVYDPIGLGVAKSLSRPGGTFTGVSNSVAEGLFGKQIELLREVTPRLKRLALLANPRNPAHTRDQERYVKGVRDQGIEPVVVNAVSREELEPAFRESVRRGATAISVLGDPLTVGQGTSIAQLAIQHRLPTMFLFNRNVVEGGLMSYGTDMVALHRRAAAYVDRILKGAKPAELPIEQPTTFELTINLKTAKSLGLVIPQSLLLRADRVIE